MKKSNLIAYLCLSVLSVGCFFFSLGFSTTDKAFTVFSSLGCSGIVSVIVAWLLECSNNRREKYRDKQIIEHLLFGYDIKVKTELQRALSNCERCEEIDLTKEYTIPEIHDLLDKMEASNVYFKGFPIMLEKALSNLSAITLLQFQKNNDGLQLHEMFGALQGYLDEMNRFLDNNGCDGMLKTFVLLSVDMFDEINMARNKNVKYALPKETANYILTVRRAKTAKKEEN